MVGKGIQESEGRIGSDTPQAIGECFFRETAGSQGRKRITDSKRDEQLTEGRDDEEKDERSEAKTGADRRFPRAE